jgi:hypothetical protein
VGVAAPANAYTDETYFLQLQVAHGWEIWNPAVHVAQARQVCDRLSYGENGYQVTDDTYYTHGPWTRSEAMSFVQDAATALYPWTW